MSPDEKILSSAEIVQNANSFTSLYFSQRGLSGVSDEEKAKAFYDVQKVDYHIYGLEDKYKRKLCICRSQPIHHFMAQTVCVLEIHQKRPLFKGCLR